MAFSNGNESFSGYADARDDVASANDALLLYLQGKLGSGVSNVKFTGDDEGTIFRSGFVESYFIEGAYDIKDGLFLSNSGATRPGDADLEETLSKAGIEAKTFDASVLEFTINVDEPGLGLSLSSFFSTIDIAEFPDISAIYVNGVNYALFNGDEKTPFTYNSGAEELGVFNENGVVNDYDNNKAFLEYDTPWRNFSDEVVIKAPLNVGENTIKIAIADARDSKIPSSLYLDDLKIISIKEGEAGLSVPSLETRTFAEDADIKGLKTASEAVESYLNSYLDGAVSNVAYTGADGAAYFVPEFNVDGAFSVEDGIFLSTGGMVAPQNTNTATSVENGTAGDDDLTNVAQSVFEGTQSTNDASVLTFNVTLDDVTVDGFSFDLVFGSDEYNEFTDLFTDIAAVYINGVNVALFDPSDENSVLAFTQENVDKGNFVHNDFEEGDFSGEDDFFEEEDFSGEDDFTGEGDFEDGLGEEGEVRGDYNIGWDAFISPLTIRGALNQGVNQIKIAIADTNDQAVDSGLFVSNFQFYSGGASSDSLLNKVEIAEGAETHQASEFEEYIKIDYHSDPLTITGTALELNGDVISGFTPITELFMNFGFPEDVSDLYGVEYGTAYNIEDMSSIFSIKYGSAVIDIDSDMDGIKETQITLEGQFEAGEFFATFSEDGVSITYNDDVKNVLNGSKKDDVLYGLAGNDKIKGKAGDDIIEGGEGNDKVFGNAGADVLYGDEGADKIKGGGGADQLIGGLGKDKLFGQKGNDLLVGDGGDDILKGAGGADILSGGDGNDVLSGGGGADTFVFIASETGHDTIKDFKGKDTFYFVGSLGEFEAEEAFETVDEALFSSAEQVGKDVVFTFDDDTSLTFLKTTIETIQGSYEIF